MQRQNILRTLLFVVFFSIGATAVYVSIISDELIGHYHKKRLLKAKQEDTNRLESLNADYDAVLEQVKKDPNLIKRLGPATLGSEPENKEAVYPKATPEQLDAARKALTEDSDTQPTEPMVPNWLIRCSQPIRRAILFLAGAVLILISFMCFGPAKKRNQ